jgi:hypothetical protein
MHKTKCYEPRVYYLHLWALLISLWWVSEGQIAPLRLLGASIAWVMILISIVLFQQAKTLKPQNPILKERVPQFKDSPKPIGSQSVKWMSILLLLSSTGLAYQLTPWFALFILIYAAAKLAHKGLKSQTAYADLFMSLIVSAIAPLAYFIAEIPLSDAAIVLYASFSLWFLLYF